MEKQYTCRFDIDYRNGDVEIKLNGEGQDIYFKFMIAFVSIPSFFYVLLQLWNGKTNKTEIDGFGFAVIYYLTVEEKSLCIERLTFDENGQPIFYNYKFDFERFTKAVDKGFSGYLQEQRNEGILPLKVDEHTHPLSKQVIKEYEEFSTIINEGKLNPISILELEAAEGNILLDDSHASFFLNSEKEGMQFIIKSDYKRVYKLGMFVICYRGEGIEETVVQTIFEDMVDAVNCVELLVQSLENGYGKDTLGI
ncbi:hypothetical protein [Bacillus sp. FJAT-22090]|uniref:hypothetical protein n=1 Tax=Bacillus sp. FJAT-22090 TaxID=1581038 RepID=UPI00119E0ED0|nr:hypothetical protein [Bacillus sp. FJAT-22090]